MTDIQNRRLLYLKAFLFVLIGGTASLLIVLDQPRFRTVLLLAVTVWAFCRAYYFAFYVIEHYIDPDYKYQGLASFAAYLLRRRKNR